jgi:hypothetical protein
MKLNFKLRKTGTVVISLFTVVSVIIAIFAYQFWCYCIAGLACYVFYSCSKSDAFSQEPDVAWLVAVVSIIVTIVAVIARLLYFICKWLLHIIIKTPPAKFPF